MANHEDMKHRLVSPFILCQHAAGQREGRLDGVALFADIAGFSKITSRLMVEGQNGAEALAVLMRAVYEPIVAAVYLQGGFITAFAGDAFTALFPAVGTPWQAEPLAASAAQRALAAAWAVRQHMVAQHEAKTPYATFALAVKLGLAAGEVDWGIISGRDDNRAAFYFRGQPIDASAGAEKFASDNDLILAPSVQESLADLVTGTLAEAHFRVSDVTGTLPQPVPFDLATVPYERQTAFYPAAVVSQTHSGEFRHNINVFINLEGDPTTAQLTEVVQAVLQLQGHYGGLLNRIDFGDKGCSLLLFWGAPVSYENDVERALDFVLALQDASPLSLRAGVTMSIAHAGFIGSAMHEEYTCYGNGVNMSARLMGAAPWDSIWLDEGISGQATGAFDIEFEHKQHFKGAEAEQAVHVLLGRSAVDVASFYQGKLVGRAQELEALRRFADPLLDAGAVERFAGIALVTGNMGQGKSRLGHDFQLALDKDVEPGQSPQWFLCQTDQMLRQPLNPFRYWLRHYFGQASAQSEARNKRAFSRKLRQLINSVNGSQLKADLEQGQSFLGALVDLQWENSLYAQFDAQARFENTLRALKTVLLAESLRRPVLLFVEDVDWLDDESREFIQRLTRNVAAYPLAIILTARDRTNASWLFGLSGVNVQTIPLANLGPAELYELAASVLGDPVTPALLQLLNARTSGNPYFAEQLLRFMRDETLLVQEDAGWGPHPDALNSSRVPANVRHLFTVRLDGLAADVREMVQTAAVLGREFELSWLQAMLPDADGLREQLTAAEQAEVVTGLSRMQYIFRSVLLRDVAYEMQVQARRRELHLVAAQTLEVMYAADLAPFYGQIGYHYEKAYHQGLFGVQEQALTYLRQAGEQAAANYENEAAVDFFSRALDLVAPADLPTRFELLLAREDVCHKGGLRATQRSDLKELAEVAARLDDPIRRADAAQREARYQHEIAADIPAALAATALALAAATDAGDKTRQARSRFDWAKSLLRKGQLNAAAEQLELALNLARQKEDKQIEAEIVRASGIVSVLTGSLEDGVRLFNQALALCREIGDRLGEGANLMNLGVALSFAFPEQALVAFEKGRDHSQQIGDQIGHLLCLGNAAEVLLILGDWQQAMPYAEQMFQLSQEHGLRLVEAGGMVALGRAHFLAGRTETALEYLQPGLDFAREMGDWEAEPNALLFLAQALSHLERKKEAQALFAELLEKAVAQDDDFYQLSALAGLVEMSLALGESGQAFDYADELLPRLANHEFGFRVSEAENYLAGYRVLAAAKDERAPAILQAGYESLQDVATRLEQETLRRSFLENVAANRELIALYGQLFPDGIPTEKADLTALFPQLPTKIGAIPVTENGTVVPETEAQTAFTPSADPAVPGDGAVETIPVPDEAQAEPTADLAELARMSLPPAPAAAPSKPPSAAPKSAVTVASRPSPADRSQVDLSGAGLAGARLNGADLRGVNLRGADLRGADLRGADLRGADLRGADLRGADLRGGNLADVVADDETIWPQS